MNEALQLTKHTIDARAARFRNLVVAVVAVVGACLLGAAVLVSWKPLLGVLLLVTLVGAFLWADDRLVDDWRRKITGLWVHQGLDLDIFARAMRGIPIFPPRVLLGMLRTLPTKETGISAAGLTPPLRQAVGEALSTISRCHADRTALATLAYTAGLASLAWAAIIGSWVPVAGCLLALPLLGLSHASTSLRLRSWQWQVRQILPEETDRRSFAAIARQLDWGSIPSPRKEKWLDSLAQGPLLIQQTASGGPL